MTDPTLVPATKLIGIPSSSKTFSTPMCARPRAKPPPNAIPMEGVFANGTGVWTRARGRLNSLANAEMDRATLPILFNVTGTPHAGDTANYNTYDAALQWNVSAEVHFGTLLEWP